MSRSKQNNKSRLFFWDAKSHFVWHSKCCSGISPSSLAAIRPRIPESGAAPTSYLELGEGGAPVCFLRRAAGPCWRPIGPGDRRSVSGVVSDGHRRWVGGGRERDWPSTKFLLHTVQVVPQPPLRCMSVCLRGSSFPDERGGGEGKKKKWEALSAPPEKKRINVSQVDN